MPCDNYVVVPYVHVLRDLRGCVHEKLLTTQVEVANREEHLKKVAERQKLAEEQIKRFEAELMDAQQKKNAEVWIEAQNTYYVLNFITRV